jgi:hypothetical protein
LSSISKILAYSIPPEQTTKEKKISAGEILIPAGKLQRK